jgi:hypothetical protein
MEQRKFTVEYTRIDTDDAVDVSFELSEDAEDALFTGIANRLHTRAGNGSFDGHLVHLYKRLAEQQESHPPWIDTSVDRTYDIELTEADYSELSHIIGKQMTHVISPDGADKYEELVSVWRAITAQMLDQDTNQVPNDPDRGEFQHLRHQTVAVYKDSETGERWSHCIGCDTAFANVPDNHECGENE